MGRPCSSSPVTSSPIASDAVAGTTSSGPSDGSRFAWPAASAAPHTDAAFSGKYQIGCQPSASSAASSTFLGPSAATNIGIRSQRDRVVPAGVLQPLPPPDLAADLDDLPRPADRRVVRDAVPALDHLR